MPGKGQGVIAREVIKKEEVVCELFFDSVKSRTFAINAVQGGEDAFLSNSLKTIDDCFNHSCEPTTRLDLSRAIFIALKDLNVGEEVTWNYLTTEYDLLKNEEGFYCICGAKNCIGYIRGFKYLNDSQKQELGPHLSPFLRTMML